MARQMKPSGVAWMGDIPSTWETKRIKDMNPHYLSGVWGDYAQCSSSGVIVLRSTEQNVNGDLNIKEPAILDIPVIRKNNVLQAKDLLLTKSSGSLSHVGKCSYITESSGAGACFSNFMMGMRFKDNVFTRFLYFVLNTPFIKEQMRNTSLSITLNNLTNSTVNSLYVLLPSLSEQTAIASFLDDRTTAIDSKIQLLEEKATALADLRKSVIHQAVTKGLDPNVAMKPSGVDWIGDVPGHWAVTRIKNVVSIVKGKKPHLLATNADTRAPYLSARVIRGTEEPQYAELSDSQSVMATANDILIIMDGSNSGEIFTNVAGVVSSTMGKLNYRSSVTKKMLMYFLDILFDTFNSEKVGAAIPHLDKDAFNKAEIVLPSICEQEAICSYLDVYVVMIDESIKTITEQIVTLKSLRQSLIHEAVTGKIDVAEHGYNYE